MQSRQNELFLDLDRDLHTTQEDINALRKIKLHVFRSSDDYVRFLIEPQLSDLRHKRDNILKLLI